MDENKQIQNDVIFTERAIAVPYNYRISYKVSMICMIIGKCCGKRGCSAIKLQMINAATTNKKAKKELFEIISNPFVVETRLIRFDPSIIRAINLTLIEGLAYRQSNSLYRLTDKGKELVEKIYKDESVMTVEKSLFGELSSKLTEGIITRISENWRLE